MIALDIRMPEVCITCPCFKTTNAISKYEDEKWFFRMCGAKEKILGRVRWDGHVVCDEGWDDFSKPDWCPWIEMEG